MTRRMQALVIVRVRCLCRFRTLPDQIPYANGENTYRHNKRAIQYRYLIALTHIIIELI